MKLQAFSGNTHNSLVNHLDNSPLLSRWVDPESHVSSYLLKQKVAPLQQSFYYVNPSLTLDGRYYWFYCAFPPAANAGRGRTLGVVDFIQGTIQHFPDTQFDEASPCIDASTGKVYWANDKGIWSRSPHDGDTPQLVNRFPAEFVGNRTVARYATHLTFSADSRALNIDAEIGNDLYIGHAPLNGDPIVIWEEIPRGYNHAQFHPTDNNLQLVAQDHYVDRETWNIHFYENRLWLIRRGGKMQPVYPEKTGSNYHATIETGHFQVTGVCEVDDSRRMHGHEWWGRDGRHLWYLHYGKGVERLELGSTQPVLMWPHKTLSHAHSDYFEHYLVADIVPSNAPSARHVAFKNLLTGRTVNVVSRLPGLSRLQSHYHVHPHPQFCLNDELICYTTTVMGRVDVAFTKVSDLVELTRG